MVAAVEHEKLHPVALEAMIATGVVLLAVAGIGPPVAEDAQTVLLALGGAVGIVRPEIVVVPDRVGGFFPDDFFETGHGAEHVVVVAQQAGIRGVAVVVVAQHQQQIEVVARRHLAEGRRREMSATADTRTESHPQGAAILRRRSGDEGRIGPRQRRGTVEQRSVMIAGRGPQTVHGHLSGEGAVLDQIRSLHDPTVGQIRLQTDPEREPSRVGTLRPQPGRGIADMTDQRTGVQKSRAGHRGDLRDGVELLFPFGRSCLSFQSGAGGQHGGTDHEFAAGGGEGSGHNKSRIGNRE